ncbi:MAG: hypothetical protein GC205_06215 [Bacteroidetes bacterium]|nr:hypothetical protein [Bacteroidota bacterium]
MSQLDDENYVAGALTRLFDLEAGLAPTLSLADVQEALAQRIAVLAAHDPEQLFRLLYRIDVSEALAQRALAAGNPSALAGAIMARMVENAHTRRNLSLDDGEGDW